MKCPACNSGNPQEANFCSNCGSAISDPLAMEKVRAIAQAKIEKLVERGLREINLGEREAVVRVEKELFNRVKFYGVIGSMIIGVGAYFGISGIKSITEFKEETEAVRNEAIAAGNAATRELADIKLTAEESKELQGVLDDTVEKSRTAVKEGEDFLDRLKEGQDAIIELIADAEDKLKLAVNAKYKFSIHVPQGGDETEFEPLLQRLRGALRDEQFHVRAEDTLWLSVDKTEILYYYYGDMERAENVRDVLKEEGVTAPIRMEDIPSRNYEIQIKIAYLPAP